MGYQDRFLRCIVCWCPNILCILSYELACLAFYGVVFLRKIGVESEVVIASGRVTIDAHPALDTLAASFNTLNLQLIITQNREDVEGAYVT